jgi:glutamine amidotransferase
VSDAPDLAILDLGYGNISSIALAFERLGCAPVRTADPDVLRSAQRVVVPGVGAAGFAMARIDDLGLRDVIPALTQPVLGICLGMHLMFEHSEEGDVGMLGVIPGRVRRIAAAPGRPVPRMGWSALSLRVPVAGLKDGDYAYFAHSFACDDGPASIAVAEYGGAIPAVVEHGNVIAAQFHPERSGAIGAAFLMAFLARTSEPMPC